LHLLRIPLNDVLIFQRIDCFDKQLIVLSL